MKLLLLLAMTYCLSHADSGITGPMDDVKIISKTGKCKGETRRMLIKNISDSRYVSATIQKDIWIDGVRKSSSMHFFEKLAPGEERDVECVGCTISVSHRICTYITITNAMYASP